MSGDLEDFLKRAAQRRQANASQQQQQQQSAASSRPKRREYTDSRKERLPQADQGEDLEEVMLAEIVGDHQTPLAEKQQETEAAKKRAAEAEAAAQQQAAKTQKSAGGAAPASPLGKNPAEELRQMLKQPGGLRQAILLKEILDRPEHRW